MNIKDECYTLYKDVEAELKHYIEHFKGKTVYSNCDVPYASKFTRYFVINFQDLGLKRYISTSFSGVPSENQLSLFESQEPKKGLVLDVTESDSQNPKRFIKQHTKPLKGDGDFRSEECVEYLKQADIVVTNPPFSLFREYIALLRKFDKQFLVLGNQQAIDYANIYPLIMSRDVHVGVNFGKQFFKVHKDYPERETHFYIDANGQKWCDNWQCCWFTTLKADVDKPFFELNAVYEDNEDKYPRYVNYDAINIDFLSEIPSDFWDTMGVPENFINVWNDKQFEFVGFRKGNDGKDLAYIREGKRYTPFNRVLIRRIR